MGTNRYTYADNNPVNVRHPSGHCADDCGGGDGYDKSQDHDTKKEDPKASDGIQVATTINHLDGDCEGDCEQHSIDEKLKRDITHIMTGPHLVADPSDPQVGTSGGTIFGGMRPAEPAAASAGASDAANPQKRGPKTDENAPHNAAVRAAAQKAVDQGGEVVAGGRVKKEVGVPTPDGYKDMRRPDVLYRDKDGTLRAIQVGKTMADGSPVSREFKALEDLINRAGIPTSFMPYDK